MAGELYLKREGIMLCKPWTERVMEKFPNTFFMQPKLNGERCWVDWMGEEPVLVSSYGNEFKFFEGMKEELKRLPKLRYDGELYVHGWSRERIHSAVSRKINLNDDTESIKLNIFDIKEPGRDQTSRLFFLLGLQQFLEQGSFLKLVPTTLVEKSEWEIPANHWIEEGYEGVVMRHPLGFYEEMKRNCCIKFKPTEEDIYLIVGVEEEISIHGVPKGSLGAFVVRSFDSEVTFNVGTGPALTKERREQYWKFREAIIGKRLRVKHEKLRTINNKPIATVALEVIN